MMKLFREIASELNDELVKLIPEKYYVRKTDSKNNLNL
jgi:hypothetical protein